MLSFNVIQFISFANTETHKAGLKDFTKFLRFRKHMW